ncbi:MAG: outer membrane protein transport protein [Bryobacterales bacterium]|nr:outer membrane protein transport protein [Bryobacterales bacterium]
MIFKLAVTWIFACIVFGACCQAQDFYWTTAGARSMALGGVYVPSADGVMEALAANPAGLTTISAPTIDLNLTSTFARGSFTNSVNPDAHLRDSPATIPYGAFGAPIAHSRFSFGIGVAPLLLSVADWRYVDAPGFAGASYGLQQQKSAILAAELGAGVGIAVSKAVDVGISFGAVYNSNTLDAPYIFQSNPALAGLKTLLDLHTTGIGWNSSVGVIARPSTRLTVNAAWKSRTVIDSTGTARGDLSQQFAALGIEAPSGFAYSARVHNVLPQSVLAGVNWRVDGRWIFGLQGNWVNWSNAFTGLPVAITGGTNPAINGLLNSSSIADRVPLLWKDQFSIHAGVERLLTERLSVRAGYAHSTNPVPASTLSPLTAAIMTDQFSTGLGYRFARWHFDLAYGFSPAAQESVRESALLSGEYSNSSVRIGTQSLALNTSFQF